MSERVVVGALQPALRGVHEAQWLSLLDVARRQNVDLIGFAGSELHDVLDSSGHASAAYERVTGRRIQGLIVFAPCLQPHVEFADVDAFVSGFAPLRIVT